MKVAVSQWLREARERLPEPQVLLVPGHFFYTRRFELTPGMARDEVEAFLGLSLEGSAPFPLEQLVWSYYHPPGSAAALVMATTRPRLRALGDLPLEDFYHAFPGFATVFGLPPADAPAIRFVAQNGSLSALFLAAGATLPERILSRPITADVLTDEAVLASRDRLAAELTGGGFEPEAGVWLGDGVEINAKGQPVFLHRRLGTDAPEPAGHSLDLDNGALWALDLRETAFASRTRSERRLAHRLWAGLQGMAALVILLFLLQVGAWGLDRATDWINEQLVARFAAAEEINRSKQFIERLASDSEQSLDPVQMLTAVNSVRPASIFFRSAGGEQAEDGPGMVLRFEGECREDVGTVNAYADAIRALDPVLAVEASTDIQGGRTFFDMAVTFDPARLNDGAAPAAPLARNPSEPAP